MEDLNWRTRCYGLQDINNQLEKENEQYKQQIDELIKKYEEKFQDQEQIIKDIENKKYNVNSDIHCGRAYSYKEIINDLSKLKEHDKESL